MIIRNKKYQPENKVALHYQRKDNASTQVQKKKRGFHFHLSASEMTETTKQVIGCTTVHLHTRTIAPHKLLNKSYQRNSQSEPFAGTSSPKNTSQIVLNILN